MASAAELAILITADVAGVNKALDGINSQIEKTGKSVAGVSGKLGGVGQDISKSLSAFDGSKIASEATDAAKGIEKIGGVSRLTEKELASVRSTTSEAVAKFKAMGKEVPPDIARLSAELEKAGSSTSSLGDKASGLASKLGGLGTIAAAGAAAGGAALLGFGAMAVSAASDVAESQNKVNVVFGDSASKIDELAATAASSLGQTKGEVLAAAGGIGNLLTAMGQSKEGAADMSVQMVKLAADLGSFNNASSSEVLEAMQAAMAGETDGMKKYGVAINEATLKAAAMKAGLGDNVQALSAAEKQMLSMNIMMEQTTSAQGDFANTSDGMANSMKIIKANVADAAASIGGALLPVVQPLISKVAELAKTLAGQVGPAIEQVKTWLQPLTDAFADSGGGIDGLVGMFDLLGEKLGLISAGDAGSAFQSIKDAIMGIDWAGIGEQVMTFAGYFMDGLGVVLPIIAGIFTNVLLPVLTTVFGFLMDHKETLLAVGAAFLILTNPIAAVVAAIMAIGAIVPMITGWWAEATAGTSAAWDGILAYIAGVWEGIKTGIGDAVAAVGEFITAAWDGYLATIQGIQDAIYNYLIGIWLAIPADIRADLELIAAHMVEKWTEIKDIITDKIEAARVLISAKWDAIREYLDAKLAQISAAVAAIWDAISSKIADVMKAVQDKINEAWSWIGEFIDGILADIQQTINAALDWVESKTGVSMGAIKGIWNDAIGGIRDLVAAAIEIIKGNWEDGLERMKTAAGDIWAGIKDAFSAGWNAIKDILKIDELVAKFKQGMAALEKVGGDIVDGLKQGIANAWAGLKDWFANKIRELLGDIKGLLGIKSPSKVMAAEIGVPMGLGVIAGLKASLDAESAGGIIAGWATKQGPGFIAKMITPVIGAALGAAITAGLVKAGAAPELVNSGKGWSVWNNFQGGSRVGIQPGSMGKKPDDGRIRADAFHSGKGGLLAASSSNYWQVFVAKWGVPTEASARKVSAQLGIPLPQWLLDIYNPPQGDKVDRPDVLKDPTPAMEAGAALEHLAKAAADVADALKAVPVRFALEVEKAAGIIGKAMGGLDDLIPRMGGGNPGVRPLPGGGIGGPIVIDPPGGTSVFGGGSGAGSYGTGTVMLATQTVNLAGPVNVGFTGTFQVGSGRSLAVELVDAIIADTGTFDKLLRAEDNRRGQKP